MILHRILFRSARVVGLASLALVAMSPSTAETQRADTGKPAVLTVTSRDGTRIAYDRVGTGPSLVVVGGALSDRTGGAELAKLLAPHFTVYSYDRRGRGESGDTAPYAVQREVEDLEAILGAAGGAAYVYAKSSGAALSLQAAAAFGDKFRKLALYEAPFDDAAGAAAEWRDLTARVDRQLAAGRRDEAVTTFLTFVGMPGEMLAKMKQSPAWPALVAMAHTLAYDNAVVGADRAVPVGIASRVKVPTLVMDGGASLKSAPSMRATADKLGKVIPGATRRVIEGQAHDVSPSALAPILVEFFQPE